MMPQEIKLPHITEEEALRRIINWLKIAKRIDNPFNSDYGHQLYVPHVVSECLQEELNRFKKSGVMQQFSYDPNQAGSEVFYDAVWTLCRNGILRPNPPNINTKGQDSGRGFSVTSYGRKWLQEANSYDCIPAEYGRFAELLSNHSKRFGDGYHSRSQEAISCYRAHTYFACCAMCGASAESIMLAIAVTKNRSEENTLNLYKSANGRSKIENFITGQQKDRIKQEFLNFTSLLKYWRDNAAHGALVKIGEEEGFTSILLLLRFARFADENWDELTT